MLKWIFYGALALSILMEPLLVQTRHATFWWHKVPGFNAIYGLLACLIIILVSKTLGRFFLQRSEDYYDD